MSWTETIIDKPSWSGVLGWVAALMGVSTGFPSMSSNPLVWDGLKLLVLGSVIETGRRIFRWIVDRFQFRYSVSAEFEAGDISYEWLVNYLMRENVWHTPRNIFVKAKNSQRKWKFQAEADNGQVDYVPDYGAVQFFRWKGYWLEVSRLQDGALYQPYMGEFEPIHGGRHRHSSLSLSIYTLNMSVLFAFVEECRLKYAEHTKSDVTVYSIDSSDYYDRESDWTNVKMKRRRPLDSLLLDEGMVDSLLADAREFLSVEDWYITAGIPHRRGYLLYGPPGTGKTSTVYTTAGELGLEIYALSLSAKNMDDSFLARLVSNLPPKGILLIEDIDCAFPSREELEEEQLRRSSYPPFNQKSQVTMSGLLNILDGIGSEEGKIFFATTNHIDRLDPALMRPGRIDRRIEYKLASQKQAHALFLRFFPASRFATSSNISEVKESQDMSKLADEFALAIPEDEFSMAELQGYLLDWKADPIEAMRGIGTWVEREREVRREKETREQLRKEKAAEAKAQERFNVYEPVIAGIGSAMDPGRGRRHRRRPRRHSLSSSSSHEHSSEADPRTHSSPESSDQEDAPKKLVLPFPAKIVNGVNKSPPESSPQQSSREAYAINSI